MISVPRRLGGRWLTAACSLAIALVAWVSPAAATTPAPHPGPKLAANAEAMATSATHPDLSQIAPCAATNTCSPQAFADAVLAYPGIAAPITAANEYAIEIWARAEGGGAGCGSQLPRVAPWANSSGPAGNPLNTTQPEPGATNWNSVGVKIFTDIQGQTCWYWGIVATGTTLLNGYYPKIITALQNPQATASAQCIALAAAVGATPWGTGNFHAVCGSGPAPSAPNAPVIQSVVAANARAKVTWAAPTAPGTSPVSGYVVTPFLGTVAQPTISVAGTATTDTVTGLVNGDGYTFTVAAVSSVGSSPPSGRSAPVVPPFSTGSAFVTRQYQDFEGRAPDGTGLIYWLGQLQSGASPGAAIAAFRDSTDATTNVDPVARLYIATFVRVPDPSGLGYWASQKRSGQPLSRIADRMIGAPEFKATYGDVTSTSFVIILYNNVLHRASDSSGLAYWVGQLDSGKMTHGQVLVGFSESSENKTRVQPVIDATVTWIDMLGTSADNPTVLTWIANLTNGQPVSAMGTALLQSPDYATRVSG